ncbi:MAG: trans-aconitate 2-methyltransferase [Mycobacterium sp.]|nr:trans-aconitate 2-methyltransferase [Mycobacterium sp.]
MWTPDTYVACPYHRGPPFSAGRPRGGAGAPRRVVDLGCGPGNLTATLPQRWPDAVLEAVDSSPEMVAAARARGVDAHVVDAADWAPRPDTDVVVSNAVLQWIPNHVELLRRWVGALPKGAWLAFQVPGNFDSPSHEAVREVAGRAPFADALADIRFRAGKVVEDPAGYAAVLSAEGCTVDAWETTYLHQLTGPTPVLDWITGTALTDVRARLTADAWEQYRQEIIPLLAQAYPPQPDGTTFFPFRRIFVVAQI